MRFFEAAHFSHSLCTITHRQKARDWRIRESDHRTLCELICLHHTRLFYLFIFFVHSRCFCSFFLLLLHINLYIFVVAGCSRCNMYKSRCAALYYILLLIPRFFFIYSTYRSRSRCRSRSLVIAKQILFCPLRIFFILLSFFIYSNFFSHTHILFA